jgi:molecular chaperone GrpE
MKRTEKPDDTRPDETEDGLPLEGADGDLAGDDEFAVLVRERNEFREQWERARADYHNLLARLPRQVDEGVRREVEPRLSELLAVLDYLVMALASPAQSNDAKAIVFGVDMVKKLLVDTLTNMGVEPIDVAVGAPLDPARHSAIATRDVPAAADAPADGTIVSVEKRGYTWKGRPLRHAQVTVARRVSAGAPTDAPTNS